MDLKTGALLSPLKHDAAVLCLAISPDGTKLVTGCSDASHVWDLRIGNELTATLKNNGSIHHVAITPDGKKFITGNWNKIGLAQVWDLATGQPTAPPVRHKGGIESLTISPDGTKAISGSADGEIRVWNIQSGQDLIRPLKHTGYVFSLAVSRDGKRLFSASSDGSSRVWDLATGEPLAQLFWRAAIRGFSSDGTRIVTDSGIWDIPPHAMEIPHWFLELAEAIAAVRLGDNGAIETVPPEQYFDIRNKLLGMKDGPGIETWAKWLVADRKTRTLSPLSRVIAPRREPKN